MNLANSSLNNEANKSSSSTSNASKNIRLQFENALKLKKRKLEKNNINLSFNDNSNTESFTIVEEENEDAKLRKKATDTLIREAKNASIRASLVGSQGWTKPQSLNTNKNFLARTLISVELSRKNKNNKIKEKKTK